MTYTAITSRLHIAALCLAGILAAPCQAATFGFSGQLDLIATNTGSGRYAAVPLGQTFSGSFSYGTEAQASTDPAFPGDYDFFIPPFGGSISNGTTVTTGSTGEIVQVSVADDVVLDSATADLINSLLGTVLASGDVVDIADIDTAEQLGSGGSLVFGVSFIALDSSIRSGTDFASFPPESGIFDRALFFISEFDAAGSLLYEGYGELTAVPVPPALLLFATGLLGLAGCARRRC